MASSTRIPLQPTNPGRTLTSAEYDTWAAEVKELARDRGAVILAHNYQVPEIQDIGDYVALDVRWPIRSTLTNFEPGKPSIPALRSWPM